MKLNRQQFTQTHRATGPHRHLARVVAMCFLVWSFAAQVVQGATIQQLDISLSSMTWVDGDIVGITPDNAIVRSTDDGVSFNNLREATPSDALYAIAGSGTTVIAGGASGLLLRADLATAPETWTEVSSGMISGEIRGIAHDGSGNWLAVASAGSDGQILRSTNNGTTWSVVASPPAAALESVVYHAAGNRWIAVGGDGFEGAAAYSANGLVWQTATLPLFTEQLLSVAVDSAGQVIAVGEGVIVRSQDGGLTYTTVADAPSEDLISVVTVSPGVFAAVGQAGIVVQVDNGILSILAHPAIGAATLYSVLSIDGSILIPGLASVPAPTISPNGGHFAQPVSVSISSTSGANLYYTMDGSIPTPASIPYTGSFTIGQNTVLRAVAVDNGIPGNVATASFTFEPTVYSPLPPPEVSWLAAGTIQIVLPESNADVPHQLSVSADLSSWTNLQAPKTGNGGSLTWTVAVQPAQRFFRVYIVK